MALWLNKFFLLWIIATATARREDLPRKILLNDLLLKKGRFPLHDSVSHHKPVLYCYKSINRFSLDGLTKAWSGIEITLYDFEDLVINVGNNTADLLQSLHSSSSWEGDKFRTIVSPFKTQCVGMATALREVAGFTLDAKSMVLLYLPVLMGVGVLLFFVAHSLSRSVGLYYGGGVVVGVLASILILLYVFSKFVPKKNILGLGLFAGGWTIFGTLIYFFLEHLYDIVKEYWLYLSVYVLVAAVISFAVLYRVGPITNQRTFDLIQWSIQIVGLGLIYFSTQMFELSLLICVLVLLMYILPARYNPLLMPLLLLYQAIYCLFYPIIVCLRCFSFLNPFTWFTSPLRKKLLTQQEYEEQGRVETEKALHDLRKHCQKMSTKGMVNIMSRLRNSNKFTRFLDGSSHVNSEEQVAHDWAYGGIESSDEEDYDDSEHSSAAHSSSMESSHYSFSDSPPRPHPSPSRHQGQRSPPNRAYVNRSNVHFRSPPSSAKSYHTTYY